MKTAQRLLKNYIEQKRRELFDLEKGILSAHQSWLDLQLNLEGMPNMEMNGVWDQYFDEPYPLTFEDMNTE